MPDRRRPENSIPASGGPSPQVVPPGVRSELDTRSRSGQAERNAGYNMAFAIQFLQAASSIKSAAALPFLRTRPNSNPLLLWKARHAT